MGVRKEDCQKNTGEAKSSRIFVFGTKELTIQCPPDYQSEERLLNRCSSHGACELFDSYHSFTNIDLLESESINRSPAFYFKRQLRTRDFAITPPIEKHSEDFNPIREFLDYNQLQNEKPKETGRTETELKNDFLYRIIDSFSHPFYIIDVNDYTIKVVNKAARIDNLSSNTTCHSVLHKSGIGCRIIGVSLRKAGK